MRGHEEATIELMNKESRLRLGIQKLEERIAEHDNPHGEGEEQYVAGLRDALALFGEIT